MSTDFMGSWGRAARWGLAMVMPWLLGACATQAPSAGPAPRATVYAVTQQHALIRFEAARPGVVLARRSLQGLAEGESVRGIDYRVARGVLYAITSSGRLYTVDPETARLTPVAAAAPTPWPVQGEITGFDFNPTVDRIRVVSASGQSLRLHPDTGAVVDAQPDQPGLQLDGALHYVASDAQAGQRPDIAGVAYTYNTRNDKLTTNYVIDRSRGWLVMQGSAEGAQPVVSPNTGQLRSVGALGLGPLAEAVFDIADVDNTALLAARGVGAAQTQLYQLDLVSGQARLLGPVGQGERLLGLAIAP